MFLYRLQLRGTASEWSHKQANEWTMNYLINMHEWEWIPHGEHNICAPSCYLLVHEKRCCLLRSHMELKMGPALLQETTTTHFPPQDPPIKTGRNNPRQIQSLVHDSNMSLGENSGQVPLSPFKYFSIVLLFLSSLHPHHRLTYLL